MPREKTGVSEIGEITHSSIQSLESLQADAYLKLDQLFIAFQQFVQLTCYEICICSRLRPQCPTAEYILLCGPTRRLGTSFGETFA